MKIYKREVRVCQEEWSGNGFNNSPNIVSEWLPEDEGEKMCNRLETDRISNDAAADRFCKNNNNCNQCKANRDASKHDKKLSKKRDKTSRMQEFEND